MPSKDFLKKTFAITIIIIAVIIIDTPATE